MGWNNLVRLLDEYPDYVVEFTILANSRATMGRSNTIFWEVRSTDAVYERNSNYADPRYWLRYGDTGD